MIFELLNLLIMLIKVLSGPLPATGTGATALNSGAIDQLSVTIPQEIFHFPASSGVNSVTMTPACFHFSLTYIW